ncbi:phage minor capsid protein [Spiroplasma endosymbiont of Labia minor]|uniref:phage minor capsid protein n=1 Tax=Spiroplasma endosymbiont of Labia minor TaxID=3066305 RepID=UPI0030CA8C24
MRNFIMLDNNLLNVGVPWWGWLIIVICLFAICIIFPWKKIKNSINNHRTSKKAVLKKHLEEINTENGVLNINIEIIKSKNRELQKKQDDSIFNSFGKKTSLRLKSIVYVEQKKDSCPLCRPFENRILSLENDDAIMTMADAISKGYHHVGCTHIDIDFYPNDTIIPENEFNLQQQDKNYELKKRLFKYENKIRDLKYRISSTDESLITELKQAEEQLIEFVNKFKLTRNVSREDYLSSFIEKWS